MPPAEKPRLPEGAQLTPTDEAPLTGMRVLHGRPAGQGETLTSALRLAGADARHEPLIAIEPPEDPAPMAAARRKLEAGEFDAIAITSANAARAIAEWDLPPRLTIASLGPATTGALLAGGRPPTIQPVLPPFTAAALAEYWAPPPGTRVLLPSSNRAAPTLPDALRARGCAVSVVTAYRTVLRPPDEALRRDLAGGRFDAVLLTSPSCLAALDGQDIAAGTWLIAIGEPTAAAARAAGRTITATAPTASDAGLLEALIDLVAPDWRETGHVPQAAPSAASKAHPDAAPRSGSHDAPPGDSIPTAKPPNGGTR